MDNKKKVENVKRFAEQIPYWVYNLLSLVSSVITILGALGGYLIIRQIPNVEIRVYWIIIVVFLFCLILLLFIKMRKYHTIAMQLRKQFSKNYYWYLHDFRNIYFDMLKHYKENERKDTIELVTKDTQKFLTSALDMLTSIFDACTGEETFACVKLIENNGDKKIDRDAARVYTFCRSSNTDRERIENDNSKNKKGVLICENTDFYEIVGSRTEPPQPFFYQGDLLKYAKDLEKVGKKYKNTRKDFDKYYKATIVAPIRVHKEHQHFSVDKDAYDIIGFLCLDSLSTNAFRNDDEYREIYSNIVKSFADEMYVVLSKYAYYIK